jgi:hypothetical protein
MEREFLKGIDFRLYVDKATYESWLQLLKGLVLAKEREYQQWQYLRQMASISSHSVSQRIPQYDNEVPELRVPHRPRSTSPRNSTISRSSAFTFSLPSHLMPPAYPHSASYSTYAMDAEDNSVHPGMKRSVDSSVEEAIFSRPAKRVAALQMDRLPTSGGPRSAGPAFSSSSTSSQLDSFSTLSITNFDNSSTHSLNPVHNEYTHQQPSSLAQPYPVHSFPPSQPQVSFNCFLYFNLICHSEPLLLHFGRISTG